MENITNRLSKIAIWLAAIVPGVYLLNYIGGILFHLPSFTYYAVLLLTAVLYIAALVIAHKIYLRIIAMLHENDGAMHHHMDVS